MVFCCGNSAIGWNTLRELFEKLDDAGVTAAIAKPDPNGLDHISAFLIPTALEHFRLVYALYERMVKGSLGLQEAIQYSIVCKATDPRDKIYGLYRMAPVKDPRAASDYSKTAQEVYIQMARYLMTTKSLIGITFCCWYQL